MVDKPANLITMASLKKALSICDTLDERPEMWVCYGDTIHRYFEAMKSTLSYHYARFDIMDGHGQYGKKRTTRRNRQNKLKERVWRERRKRCEQCGMTLTWGIARPHHIIQVSDGGDNSDENIMLLCANCHAQIHSRR